MSSETATKPKPAKRRASKDAAPDTAVVLDVNETLTDEQRETLEQLAADLKGKGLGAKIAWVQHHVASVDKTGEVSFGGTKFSHMQEHGLIGVLRPLMRIAGIGVLPGGTVPGSYRFDGNVAIIDYALTVFDAEDIESQVTRYFPNIGVDKADKGFNKAYTGAQKYALQKFFLVPTDDIDDNNTMDVAATGGSTTAAQVREITSVKPSDRDIAELRATLTQYTQEVDADFPKKVKAQLTADFGVAKVEDIPSKQDFNRFAQWVVTVMNGTPPEAPADPAPEPSGAPAE